MDQTWAERTKGMTEAERQRYGLELYVEAGDFSRYYGIQYGDPSAPRFDRAREILAEHSKGTVLEIGAGGGRWSQFFVFRGGRSILVDGTAASEAAIRGHFDVPETAEFIVSTDGKLPTVPDASVDFVWSFDVFVHFDPPLFNSYCREVARVLRSGGRFMLYYAWDGSAGKSFFRYYDPDEVGKKMKRLGLRHDSEDSLIDDTRLSMWERSQRRKK